MTKRIDPDLRAKAGPKKKADTYYGEALGVDGPTPGRRIKRLGGAKRLAKMSPEAHALMTSLVRKRA